MATESRPDVAIVIPTLNLMRATRIARLARKTAGVSTTIIIVWDYRKRGGIKPANAGFKAALDLEAPFICYLNDDCQARQDGWLRRMVEALNEDETYGIAAPSGRSRSSPQGRGKPGVETGAIVVKNPLAWFCAVIKRECVLEIGGFDRELIHYGGDSLFSALAHNRGWKSIWVSDVYLQHDIAKKFRTWKAHDMAIYKKKKND